MSTERAPYAFVKAAGDRKLEFFDYKDRALRPRLCEYCDVSVTVLRRQAACKTSNRADFSGIRARRILAFSVSDGARATCIHGNGTRIRRS